MNDVRIAIYIRLSMADEETGKSRDESNSIIHQRMLIHHFLDTHPTLSGCPRTEFVDDGFSGTNTDRPAFQRMIAMIKTGQYNLCITKDFSRFARDYIEMGDYLECLFPFLHVRYISINDGYDSDDYKGTTGGLDVVMRSIVYAAYSRDLSVKMMSGKEQSRKKGRRAGGRPAYGYMPDPNRLGFDIIDPEAAPIVRKIFDAFLIGETVSDIVKKLNEEHIPTPSQHQKDEGYEGRFKKSGGADFWSYSMVMAILQRLSYTGASVGGIKRVKAPCSQTLVKRNREDWIVVKDMHPAIISEEEYEKVQTIIASRKKKDRKVYTGQDYPLKGLVFCGICGRTMARNRKYERMYCRGAKPGDEGWEYKAGILSEKRLEETVFKEIRNMISLAEAKDSHSESHISKARCENLKKNASVVDTYKNRELLKKQKFQVYESYSAGLINKEEYLKKRQELDDKLNSLENEQYQEQDVAEYEHTKLNSLYECFRDCDSLTTEMAQAFIKKVMIFPDDRIEIIWRFTDMLEESVNQ